MKTAAEVAVFDGQGEDESGGTKTQPTDPGKNPSIPVIAVSHSMC